jgi:hypothetical protein
MAGFEVTTEEPVYNGNPADLAHSEADRPRRR